MNNSVSSDYIPILLQSVVVFGFVVITMLATHFLTAKRRKIETRKKSNNFECGIEVKGNARIPFSVKYFMVAILFVLFDVEIIFFYPYAINFRELGWGGLFSMFIFVALLLIGFFYLHRKGALKWE
ncbi:MAG: NADH-quinone oxidoreductase subunit A [Bacteroidetes bacterium]|jgi:NADH-quinone oxidoreductase subunit A|nr:NADH-quinone oxidoreductase subunit A [Bacteroidota bacterium]